MKRRNWKQKIIALGAVIAMLFAGCSAKSDDKENQESQPLKVGTIFYPTDTLEAKEAVSPGILMLLFHLHDSLVVVTTDGVQMHLADSIEPNATADEWTVTLREGLKYSDGTEVTGQDVIDSLAHLMESPNFLTIYGNLDIANSRAEGNKAILKLHAPASDFIESSLSMMSVVAPGGKFNGIGAGPYVLVKGDPNTGYEVKANENYWGGKPNIPTISFIPIADTAAGTNALRTGEVDFIWGLDSAAVKTLQNDPNIKIPEATLDSAKIMSLVLNTRVEPFNDPELRKAAKMTVDREKMVNVVLGESGEIANDLVGKGYPTYAGDIEQTTANKEEAKKIFAEKGVTEFTIIASDVVPGLVASAEFMAQEFAEIGVTVKIEKMDPQTFFSQMPQLYQSQSFTFFWTNRVPIATFQMQVLADSPYNVSGYSSDVMETNYKKATATIDKGEQTEAIVAISKDFHDNGGELIWGYQKQVHAHRVGLSDYQVFQSVVWLADATFTPNN